MSRQPVAAVRSRERSGFRSGPWSASRPASPCSAECLEARTLLAAVPAGFQDTVYAGGLASPTAMEFAPDGRLFVTLKGGQLRVITPAATGSGPGTVLPTPFVTVSTNSVGERGLLSVEFDPDFGNNGHVYVYYTATTPNIHNRVSRFTAVDADPGPDYRPGNTAAAGSEFVLMDLEPLNATNHNGGAIHFGPDGKLYIATGENAVPSYSQTLSNRFGKMLRINPDGSIPTDNPFYAQATGANRSIWALGLRNPYTFAFQPGTGRMFINDVGQSSFEEVNEGIAGANYGWPTIEGYRTTQPLPPGPGTYRDPVLAYGRSVGRTVAGGAFYNPPVPNFPDQYVGKYFFGDWVGDWVRYIDPSVNRPPISPFASGVDGAVDLDVGPDGALYHLAYSTGQVGRINWARPRIETQPQSQAVTEGSPATFTVEAVGNGTLSYQWRRNGVNIPDANAASYTLPSATSADEGARFSVVITNAFGSVTSAEATLTVLPAPPAVVGRHVFYNNSAFDRRNPAATPDDDLAIAPDKTALLPGQKASFANLTSYSRGINGVMVDVAGLPATATISNANFAFVAGKGDGKWAEAPAPVSITLRRGAGAEGSDRITLTWGDNRVANRWLRVTFTPGSPLAGASPINQDVFYFGNLRGETGDPSKLDPTRLTVTVTDQLRTRRAMHRGTAAITNRYDHNRDGRVNVLDYVVVGRNRGQSVTLLSAAPPPTAAAERVSDEVLG